MASGHSNKAAIYAAAGANMQSRGKLWKSKEGKRVKSAGKVRRLSRKQHKELSAKKRAKGKAEHSADKRLVKKTNSPWRDGDKARAKNADVVRKASGALKGSIERKESFTERKKQWDSFSPKKKKLIAGAKPKKARTERAVKKEKKNIKRLVKIGAFSARKD